MQLELSEDQIKLLIHALLTAAERDRGRAVAYTALGGKLATSISTVPLTTDH